MANMTFASFLRGDYRDFSTAAYDHPRPKLLRTLPLQVISNPPGHFAPFQSAPGHSRSNQYSHITTCDSMEEAQAYFKDFVDNPNNVFLTNPFETRPAATRPFRPSISSFRPLEVSQLARPDTTTVAPLKFERSPSLPIPNILPGNVDASKYDLVSFQDWVQAPTEYHSWSPTTIATEENSPITPAECDAHYNAGIPGASGFGNMSAYSTFAQPPQAFSRHSERYTSLPRTGHAVHAVPRASPLPSTGNILDRPRYAQHRNLYSEHQYTATTSASLHDLELQDAHGAEESSDDAYTLHSSPEYDGGAMEEESEARRERDDLLVKMREEGIPYREIKQLGKFKEAESTLRGRYRALTKDKDDRVRRPEWRPNDVALLRQAVRHYANGGTGRSHQRHAARKTPWKKVSEWMKSHGSSYLFAPATCAKKWQSLK